MPRNVANVQDLVTTSRGSYDDTDASYSVHHDIELSDYDMQFMDDHKPVLPSAQGRVLITGGGGMIGEWARSSSIRKLEAAKEHAQLTPSPQASRSYAVSSPRAPQ